MMAEAKAPPVTSGRCLCGAVRIDIAAPPIWVAHCHCTDCQRATGAAFASYAGFLCESVRIRGDDYRRFRSSPGVHRGFCERCGSAVSYQGDRWPDQIHLHLGCVDGADNLVPLAHVFMSDAMPWIKLDDGLPQYPRFSGSDDTSD